MCNTRKKYVGEKEDDVEFESVLVSKKEENWQHTATNRINIGY